MSAEKHDRVCNARKAHAGWQYICTCPLSPESSPLAQPLRLTGTAAQATAPPAVVPRSAPLPGAAGPFFDAGSAHPCGSSSDGRVTPADSSLATNPLACDGGQSIPAHGRLAAAQLDHQREAA